MPGADHGPRQHAAGRTHAAGGAVPHGGRRSAGLCGAAADRFAVNVIVQIARFRDGSRRVQRISEVCRHGRKEHLPGQDLYLFHARGVQDEKVVGSLDATGVRPSFATEPYEMGFADEVRLTAHLFRRRPSDRGAICR